MRNCAADCHRLAIRGTSTPVSLCLSKKSYSAHLFVLSQKPRSRISERDDGRTHTDRSRDRNLKLRVAFNEDQYSSREGSGYITAINKNRRPAVNVGDFPSPARRTVSPSHEDSTTMRTFRQFPHQGSHLNPPIRNLHRPGSLARMCDLKCEGRSSEAQFEPERLPTSQSRNHRFLFRPPIQSP